jgi:hypothetical protein
MRATRTPIGLFVALLALTSCDGTTPGEPPPPAVLVLEAVTPVSATGIVGKELDVAPVVLVMQADGLPVKGIRVSFVVSAGGFVGSATVMTDADGRASPGAWRLGQGAGPQTLKARAGGRSLVFTADARPGPIATLAVVGGNDQRAAGGIPLSEPLRVKATDGYGNIVTGGAVTFAVVDGGGSLEPGASITGSDGIAESRWTLGATAGRQHVRAQTSEEATAQFTAEAYCEAGQCSFELAYSLDGNVLIFDGATGGIRQLTNDDVPMLPSPAWSPDGGRIAFTRYSGVGGSGWSSPPATADVYVMYADGTGMTRVTGNAAGSLVWSHSSTWSPRGDAIAFSGDKGACVYECGALAIYVQELSEGSVPRSVAPEGFAPAWSPDGSRIAFVGLTGGDYPGSLRLVNPDGSGLTEVPLAIDGFHLLGGLDWSPDGTRIAISACNPVCNIYVVRPDGSGLIQLTTSVLDCSGCGALTPAWSPDGTRIAYTAFHYNESGTQLARIMAIPAAGGEPVTLVAPGTSPSWRP